ncbi:MAG: hypothetical protein Q9198_004153 [Flavoplaca austrocitrina]
MAEFGPQGAALGSWDDWSIPAASPSQETQSASTDDWDQQVAEQSEMEDRSRVSILARLTDRTASLRGSLQRKAAELRRRRLSSETLPCPEDDEDREEGEEYENGQDYEYDAYYEDAEDHEDGEHSEDDKLTKIKPPFFTRICKLTAVWRDTVRQKVHRLRRHAERDNVGDKSNGDSWGYPDSSTLVDDDNSQRYGIRSPDTEEEPTYPSFTTALPETSKSEDFLTVFLSERRLVDIHPERKHNLALFFFRICLEAAFDHVKLHAPIWLTIWDVDAPDHLEFETWICLMGDLRQTKEIPYDGKCWYSREVRFESYVQDCDDILRLRHVAVHHWDYDSNMIGHVVQYLEHLDDQPRRKMVEDALRELYEYECAEASKKAALAISDAYDWNRTDLSDGIFIGDVQCPRLSGKSPLVTTHHEFLKSYQTILEWSIHEVLWRGEDTVLKSLTAPHEVTMTDCRALCQKACTPSMLPLSKETRELVEDLMMSIKLIRNKAAHHEQRTLTETLEQCYENALALTYFLNDEDATRKIELTTWVAHINLSLQAAEKEREVLERSILGWEKLEVEARALGDDGSRFWIEARAAERRLWGNEADDCIRRWTESFRLDDWTDPNCTPVDWSKPEASTGPCSDDGWEIETPNIDRR